MSLKEVRLRTGFSPERIYRLAEIGRLRRARRKGQQPYYLQSSVEDYLNRVNSETDTREYEEGYLERKLRELGLVKLPEAALATG